MKRYVKFLFITPPFLLAAAALCLSRGHSGDAQQEIPAVTEEQRLQWLAVQGLPAELLHSEPVTIPPQCSGSYEAYAALQEAQGLPLAAHMGGSAECFTYEITDSDPLLYAELLTADGILIGAQCYHPEDGVTLTMEGEPFPVP